MDFPAASFHMIAACLLRSFAGKGGASEERVRSGSLLARPPAFPSGGSALTSPRGSPQSNGNGAPAPETESAWRLYKDADNGVRRNGDSVTSVPETWRTGSSSVGAPVGGDAANGWRTSLEPTGAADAAEAWRARGMSDAPPPPLPEASAPAPYQPPRREESPPPPPASATSAAIGRPRLNLQPRSKPLQAAPSNGPPPACSADSSAGPGAGNGSSAPAAVNGAAGGRASIFGAARPREEVLRERGVTEPERLTANNVAYANGGGSVSGSVAAGPVSRLAGGRPGSVTSGASDEDQWLTVGKGGRSKPPPTSADVGNALLDAASDPFFTGRTAGVPVVGRSIPSGRPYGGAGGVGGHYGSGSYGKGSYGSHGAGGDTFMNAYGASRGHGNTYGNDDDEPIFKRGLPTRHDGLF
jgi:hypothetical protein